MPSILIRNRDTELGKQLVKIFTSWCWKVVGQNPTHPEPYDLVVCNEEASLANFRDFIDNYHIEVNKGLSPSKVLVLSSARLYKELAIPYTTDENCPVQPKNMDKFREAYLIDDAALNQGFNIFRVACIVGFNPFKSKGFLAKAVACKLTGESFPLYGDGVYPRDQLHYYDLALAITNFYHSMYRQRYKIFNIGGGNLNLVTPNELLVKLEIERSHSVPAIKNEIRHYSTNYARAWNEFCWHPTLNVDEILEEMFQLGVETGEIK